MAPTLAASSAVQTEKKSAGRLAHSLAAKLAVRWESSTAALSERRSAARSAIRTAHHSAPRLAIRLACSRVAPLAQFVTAVPSVLEWALRSARSLAVTKAATLADCSAAKSEQKSTAHLVWPLVER